MSLKSWVLGRVQPLDGLVGRSDLPARATAREPGLESTTAGAPLAEPGAHHAEPALSDAEHLGVYGPLIRVIRDELEHFVISQVRLHLAIADRDRFLLTSIGVGCAGDEGARELLQRFMHEFRPEQVKRYLVREVIGALPNAAAIDLTQFGGLFDADARKDAEEEGEYAELLAALRSPPPVAVVRSYEVRIVGRWSELDASRSGGAAPAQPVATPPTPLAGQRCEFDVEDVDGRRRVVLQAVVPGRRYVVGKGEGCDIRVAGTYASRRHAELWIEQGVWWVADAGSTNGIRVESAFGPHDRSGPASAIVAEQPAKLRDGARIVLSARAEGPPHEYPWVAVRPLVEAGQHITPIAAASAVPKTPLTAILAGQPAEEVFKLTALQIAGVRTLELRPSSLPVTVGRSRNQTLVVDRRHEGVSGHHLEIVALDAEGAEVAIHGDNGVLIEGVAQPQGARVRWNVGQTMVLGGPGDDAAGCTLMLARQGAQ